MNTQTFNSYYLEMEEELKDKIYMFIHKEVEKRCYEIELENIKLKSERDKWRGKYNRLKSEFNLLKNKIGTTQK